MEAVKAGENIRAHKCEFKRRNKGTLKSRVKERVRRFVFACRVVVSFSRFLVKCRAHESRRIPQQFSTTELIAIISIFTEISVGFLFKFPAERNVTGNHPIKSNSIARTVLSSRRGFAQKFNPLFLYYIRLYIGILILFAQRAVLPWNSNAHRIYFFLPSDETKLISNNGCIYENIIYKNISTQCYGDSYEYWVQFQVRKLSSVYLYKIFE